MSHHSSSPSPFESPEERERREVQQQAMRELMRKVFGEHPAGKLNADDAGALAMSIGTESERVVIRFPKPVAWIGFTGDEAMEVANLLIKHARAVGLTKPATLSI